MPILDHLGPVSHYMASCNGNCLTFNTANAKWFKIDAAGLYPNGTWASAELIASMSGHPIMVMLSLMLILDGLSATTVIPAELESGEYVRHDPHTTPSFA